MTAKDWLNYAQGALWGGCLVEAAHRWGFEYAALLFVGAMALLAASYRFMKLPR